MSDQLLKTFFEKPDILKATSIQALIFGPPAVSLPTIKAHRHTPHQSSVGARQDMSSSSSSSTTELAWKKARFYPVIRCLILTCFSPSLLAKPTAGPTSLAAAEEEQLKLAD